MFKKISGQYFKRESERKDRGNMKRSNPYEKAFEAYLQAHQIPYLAVQEQTRNRSVNGLSLKNFDFVVMPDSSTPAVCASGKVRPKTDIHRSVENCFSSWSGQRTDLSLTASALRCRSESASEAVAESRKSWLTDVKGRLFPGGGRHKRYWRQWTTRDDLASLLHWETLFGDRFEALFVFAYLVTGSRLPVPLEDLFEYRGQQYAFFALSLYSYLGEARFISPRWQTYELPVRRFRQLARPFVEFLPR